MAVSVADWNRSVLGRAKTAQVGQDEEAGTP
jgi:hypothetical protein